MIDTTIFNLERLIDWLIGYSNSNPENIWIRDCEIIKNDKNEFVVKHKSKEYPARYLRYSKGPHQHYFWDIYGENFLIPELALIALSKAPVPHYLIERN
jgi:hypothetical protein